MRIATWNINGTRARIDFLRLWLREHQPDLVGLQELKLSDEQFPHAELEAIGYRAVSHGQKSWNGVAILSRKPVVSTQKGLPGQEGFGARLIAAQADDLSFASVYVPNGKSLEHEDFGRKLAWLDALAAHFEASYRPEDAVLLGGDFNVVPGPLDSWNEEALRGQIFHTEEERARLQRLLDWGFVDVFRARHPDSQAFSWWDYRGGAFHRRQGLRIDLMLATRSALERVTSIEIDRDYRKKKEGLTPSDHAPVIAELD